MDVSWPYKTFDNSGGIEPTVVGIGTSLCISLNVLVLKYCELVLKYSER